MKLGEKMEIYEKIKKTEKNLKSGQIENWETIETLGKNLLLGKMGLKCLDSKV